MAQISLTFPDGNARDYDAGVTPAEVAASIATSLAKKAISATVNGAHHDLQWPIDADASIAINTMADDAAALELIRHDLAHIMARAVQEIWPDVKVTIGPVIKDGWYYDFDRAEPFTPEDLGAIEKKMKEIINLRDPVRTEIWDRPRAVQFYEDAGEPYKVELIEAIPGDEPLRMYWHGDWQDLCRGPHLQHTGPGPGGCLQADVVAGAYWRGDSDRAMLQRIYGVAFTRQEKAQGASAHAGRSRQTRPPQAGPRNGPVPHAGRSPRPVFWHPNGWTDLHRTAGLHAPQAARGRLCRGEHTASREPQAVGSVGHWEKYQEHMFIVEVDEDHAREKTINALKPMNCPCHVQIFNSGLKSYRDLPLRMAEFGSCNRYEPSGALHGIMRVRGFTQDDAHIFCTRTRSRRKTPSSSSSCHRLQGPRVRDFEICATRPEKRSVDRGSWDKMEAALATRCKDRPTIRLNRAKARSTAQAGFRLTDAIGRDWQCGTLQVDPNPAERLDATYIGEDGGNTARYAAPRRPWSFERFIGILIEEHAGKLPFWLAPRQVVVASIVSDADDYVPRSWTCAAKRGVRAEADMRNEKINYKVREHQSWQSAGDPGNWSARGRRSYGQRPPLGRKADQHDGVGCVGCGTGR